MYKVKLLIAVVITESDVDLWRHMTGTDQNGKKCTYAYVSGIKEVF